MLVFLSVSEVVQYHRHWASRSWASPSTLIWSGMRMSRPSFSAAIWYLSAWPGCGAECQKTQSVCLSKPWCFRTFDTVLVCGEAAACPRKSASKRSSTSVHLSCLAWDDESTSLRYWVSLDRKVLMIWFVLAILPWSTDCWPQTTHRRFWETSWSSAPTSRPAARLRPREDSCSCLASEPSLPDEDFYSLLVSTGMIRCEQPVGMVLSES